MAKNDLVTSQKQVTEPYEPAANPWKELLSQTQGIINGKMQQFNNGPTRNVNGMGVTTAPAYGKLAASIPGLYEQMMGRAADGSAGPDRLVDKTLRMYASGGEAQNPYFNQALNMSVDDAVNRAKSANAGLGRAGSDWARDNIARTAAGISVPAMAQHYENMQGRRLGATGMLDSSQQGWEGLDQGWAGLQRALMGDRLNAEMGALGGQTNAQMQQLVGQGIKDQLTTWDPRLDFLRQAAGIYAPTNQFGATTTLEPEQPLWEKILGGILGVGGLVGGFMDQPGQGGGMIPGSGGAMAPDWRRVFA